MGIKAVEKEMRYVKKPIPVEAIQTPPTDTWSNIEEWLQTVPDWFIDAMENGTILLDLVDNAGIMVQTLEGQMLCPWGSYIIRGPKGELYPCRRDVFEETYDAVEE